MFHVILEQLHGHVSEHSVIIHLNTSLPSVSEHLGKRLVDYMAQYPRVKIVRTEKREGLIRARLLGARHASADVLTYLDSHCECTEGEFWSYVTCTSLTEETNAWGTGKWHCGISMYCQ